MAPYLGTGAGYDQLFRKVIEFDLPVWMFLHLHNPKPKSGILNLLGTGLSIPGVKLTTHLHLVLRARMVELCLHSPIRLHDMVLNKLSTRTTLPLRFTGLFIMSW
jgi:hypothetical protein